MKVKNVMINISMINYFLDKGEMENHQEMLLDMKDKTEYLNWPMYWIMHLGITLKGFLLNLLYIYLRYNSIFVLFCSYEH